MKWIALALVLVGCGGAADRTCRLQLTRATCPFGSCTPVAACIASGACGCRVDGAAAVVLPRDPASSVTVIAATAAFSGYSATSTMEPDFSCRVLWSKAGAPVDPLDLAGSWWDVFVEP